MINDVSSVFLITCLLATVTRWVTGGMPTNTTSNTRILPTGLEWRNGSLQASSGSCYIAVGTHRAKVLAYWAVMALVFTESGAAWIMMLMEEWTTDHWLAGVQINICVCCVTTPHAIKIWCREQVSFWSGSHYGVCWIADVETRLWWVRFILLLFSEINMTYWYKLEDIILIKAWNVGGMQVQPESLVMLCKYPRSFLKGHSQLKLFNTIIFISKTWIHFENEYDTYDKIYLYIIIIFYFLASWSKPIGCEAN